MPTQPWGTYRGAAVLCGTTHRTVKRVLERQQYAQIDRRSPPLRPKNTAARLRPIEAIGQSLALVIPPDRPDELPGILAGVGRGKRIDPFETVRQQKDGRRWQSG